MKIFLSVTFTETTTGETRSGVEIFNSHDEADGWLNLQIMGSTGSSSTVAGKILSSEEIDEYLLPFKAAVIAADRKKAEAKTILDEIKQANKALFEKTGTGYFFQDDEGIVYKTDECEGKFVYFDPVEIKRTRREGETKGSLSMTEARGAGFVVEGK